MEYKIKKYLITMNDYDDFVVSIKQDINRPNNPDNDELIQQYMSYNYYGHNYRAIDLDYLDYFETVEI